MDTFGNSENEKSIGNDCTNYTRNKILTAKHNHKPTMNKTEKLIEKEEGELFNKEDENVRQEARFRTGRAQGKDRRICDRRRNKTTQYKVGDFETIDENFNDSVCGSEIEFINSTTSKIKFFGDRLMMELNCRFRLNYDKSFEHFIPELHHFKLLGYNIPEVLCRLLKESRGIGFRLNTIEMLLAQYRDFCFTKPKHIVIILRFFLISDNF
ncbi:hypothetical protein O3M35_012839 [Rhynocoris fuscipes]|uniref:Uncharacterized protein n=1 Tax=Rhynocoris fuscipes TaxID=488301 RepID=A0AAW1CGE0_9HEMI